MIHILSFIQIWFQIRGVITMEVWFPAASIQRRVKSRLCILQRGVKYSHCILQRRDVTPCCILHWRLHWRSYVRKMQQGVKSYQCLMQRGVKSYHHMMQGVSIWQRGVKYKNFRRLPWSLKRQSCHEVEAKEENILRCESGAQVDTSDGKNRRSKIWRYCSFKLTKYYGYAVMTFGDSGSLTSAVTCNLSSF